MGPRILPCGTPQDMCILSDNVSPIFTIWCLFVKYDLNQLFTGPLIPNFLVYLVTFCG